MHGVVTEAEPVKRPRAEILHQDVPFLQQLL